MSDKTAISWTNATWNPVTGCSVVSPGCEHCYAATLSLRRGWSKKPWTAQNAAENVVLHPERLEAPLHWRQPRMVFVNSMSDLFHEMVPDEFIADVFGVMAVVKHHVFQVLTKRPDRMRDWFRNGQALVATTLQERIVEAFHRKTGIPLTVASVSGFAPWPLSNVWLGVSVEDQRRAQERIPLLLETPAAVRWVSAEPLLSRVYLSEWLSRSYWKSGSLTPLAGQPVYPDGGSRLNWVVLGGESGPGYRPMELDWAQEIAAECSQYDVPLFIKQDSGPRPGKQGRLPDELWARKDFPA